MPGVTQLEAEGLTVEQKTFYPNCLVQVSVRLEEYAQSLGLPPQVPGLDVGPPPKDAFLEKEARYLVRPIRFTANLNSYRMADTFECELDMRLVPFFPQIVRGAQIEAFIFGLDPAADALTWQTSPDPIQNPVLAITRTFANIGGLAFLGYADEWEVRAGGENEGDVVFIKGRDPTGLLIDTPIVNFKALELRSNLETVLASALDLVNQELEVVVFDNDGNVDNLGGPQDVSITLAEILDRQNKPDPLTGKLPPGVGTKPKVGDAKTTLHAPHVRYSVWDFVTQICTLSGYIPNVETELNAFGKSRGLLAVRPVGATWRREDFGIPRLVYGENCKKMTLTRKYGRLPAVPVRVVSYNRIRKSIRAAMMGPGMTEAVTAESKKGDPDFRPGSAAIFKALQAPAVKKGLKETRVTNERGAEIQPGEIFVVNGIKDLDTLKKVAEQLYEQIGKQETGGTIETDDMVTLDSKLSEVSILNLKAGSTIEVDFKRVSHVTDADTLLPFAAGPALIVGAISHLGQVIGADVGQYFQYLTSRGIPDDAAQALLLVLRDHKWQRKFFVRNVAHNFSAKDGYSAAIDFVNSIELRNPTQGGTP